MMCLQNYVFMHSLRGASITTIVKHSNAQKPSCMSASSGSYSSSAAPEPCTSSACCSGCAKPAKPAEMACCCSCNQMQSLCQHWEVICEGVIAMQVKQLGGRMGAAHAITDCMEAALMTGFITGKLARIPWNCMGLLQCCLHECCMQREGLLLSGTHHRKVGQDLLEAHCAVPARSQLGC